MIKKLNSLCFIVVFRGLSAILALSIGVDRTAKPSHHLPADHSDPSSLSAGFPSAFRFQDGRCFLLRQNQASDHLLSVAILHSGIHFWTVITSVGCIVIGSNIFSRLTVVDISHLLDATIICDHHDLFVNSTKSSLRSVTYEVI